MESDYSDDEYAPINLGAWGDQSQRQESVTTPNDEDPSETGVKDWTQLIDPATKASPGALGSGGLHRTGKNYKPIDEEYILKQRMKGVPQQKSNNNKTRGSRTNDSSKKGPRHAQKPKPTTFSTKRTKAAESPPRATTATKQPPARQQPPPLSTIRRPPPPSSGNSGWGAPLVDTPFWEKQQETDTQSTQSTTNGASTSWSKTGERNKTNSSQQDVPGSWNTTGSPPPPPPTQKKAMMPPPGFGHIPRRQYPVATGKRQAPPPPPPGFSYAKRPTTPPLHSSPPPSQHQQQQQTSSKPVQKGTGLDWVSGWDDIAAQHANGSNEQPTPPTQHTGWGSANFTTNTTPAHTKGPNGQPTPPTQEGGGWISENSKWASANFMGSGNTTSSSPAQFVDEQTTAFKSGRFSDPYKSRYSSGSQDSGPPLPKNYYRKDGVSRPAFMQTPSRIAAPPPSHNPVVVSVHLELENGSKVPIAIRKLDDPTLLARSFCLAQNISNPVLVNGITQLFVQQQQAALQRYSSR